MDRNSEEFLSKRSEVFSRLSEEVAGDFAEVEKLMIDKMMHDEELNEYFPAYISRRCVVRNIILHALSNKGLRKMANSARG